MCYTVGDDRPRHNTLRVLTRSMGARCSTPSDDSRIDEPALMPVPEKPIAPPANKLEHGGSVDLSDAVREAAQQPDANVLKFVSLEPVYKLLTRQGSKPAPVRLIDSDWLIARADAMLQATTEAERA